MSAISPTANLKNTKHMNIVFRAAGWDRQLTGDFLGWLAKRSDTPLSEDAREAHLDELEQRLNGKNLVSVSRESGVSLSHLGAMPILLRHFRYAPIELPRATLSVDLLNAGNELSIGEEPGGLALELFGIRGQIAASLVEVALEAVREWPVEYVFGGRAVFTADFARARLRAGEAGRELRVKDYLWPFTFSRDLARVPDETLQQLAVFQSGREGGGVWIWLFEDLSMGHSDDYFAASKALGLRSLWEPEIIDG